MGQKRKAGGRAGTTNGHKQIDEKDARLGPITTYEDVANSEDEYELNQDRLMLVDEPGSKRRRTGEDSDLELSDEEVLGEDDDDDDDMGDDDDDDVVEDVSDARAKKKKKKKAAAADDEEDGAEDEEGEDGWWGSSKNEYYNADLIETEADALEEEKEAKRLQKKRLAKMAEEDFVGTAKQWLAPDDDNDDEAGEGVVTEVLKETGIPEDAPPEEKRRLFVVRYPEFQPLADEFQKLQPVLQSMRSDLGDGTRISLATLKYWTLGCYVASIASYFAILTSPARDASNLQKSLDPVDLRDHEVMQTLVSCRAAWSRIKDVRFKHSSEDSLKEIEKLAVTVPGITLLSSKKQKKVLKEEKVRASKLAVKAARAKAIEASVADLYDLPLAGDSQKKLQKSRKDQANNSDFGEEDALDARTAADKASRKRTLKFYTSQITQKANKRADAGRDAGGDMDIPHRERLRDRQARLLAQAEKRGKRGSKFGADLGDDSAGEDDKDAKALRDDADEYYDMVSKSSKNKKDDKAARYAAYAAASKGDRIVENEEIGEDGKRKISYAIEKNKGLTPRRKKEVRNPRVKKKKQYEAKQKKLRSMKPTWKGGEPKGGYHGETAGINASVIKSVRL